MIVNAVNDFWSDICILQILIQQKLEKKTILQDNFILKIERFTKFK